LELRAHQAKGIGTRHLLVSQQGAIAAASELLRNGELVAFPTDTLYGVGADAFNPEAVKQLFLVKRRPLNKGIPILLADIGDLQRVAVDVSEMALALVDRFWPGPLTVIVGKHPGLPAIVSPNDGVALRIPDNTIARSLIRTAGGAVATSSANLSGLSPAHTGQEAMAKLGGLVAAVLDGGPCLRQTASTIVDCRGKAPVILREGPILLADLSFTELPGS